MWTLGLLNKLRIVAISRKTPRRQRNKLLIENESESDLHFFDELQLENNRHVGTMAAPMCHISAFFFFTLQIIEELNLDFLHQTSCVCRAS